MRLLVVQTMTRSRAPWPAPCGTRARRSSSRPTAARRGSRDRARVRLLECPARHRGRGRDAHPPARARVRPEPRRRDERRRRLRRLPADDARATVRTAAVPAVAGRRLEPRGRAVRLPIRARMTASCVALLAVVMAAVGGFLVVRLRADL